MNITKKKCTLCKGTGKLNDKECPQCEGLGVPLHTVLEEQFEDAAIEDGIYLYPDDERCINFEEEDYDY